jgi:hypothetical protein
VFVTFGWLTKQKNELGLNHLSSFYIQRDREIYYCSYVIPSVEVIISSLAVQMYFLVIKKIKIFSGGGKVESGGERTLVSTNFIH